MNENAGDALQLCRNLLAYTAPGAAVTVPHAALARVVELASGTVSDQGQPGREPLTELYDVAALARRYNRAPATVRQWFAAGLFGPATDRLFRGRGYVASAEAVREFEVRSGVKNVEYDRPDMGAEESPCGDEPRAAVRVRPPQRSARTPPTSGTVGLKIRAATQRAPQRT